MLEPRETVGNRVKHQRGERKLPTPEHENGRTKKKTRLGGVYILQQSETKTRQSTENLRHCVSCKHIL